MVTIEVCVGSSCHLKGSYEVVGTLDRLISDNHLSDQVELRGVFCLEHCTQGVTVRIGDQIHSIKNRQQTIDLFHEVIMAEVRRDALGDHHHKPGQL